MNLNKDLILIMPNCCTHSKNAKKCTNGIREFKLPRKFSRERCIYGKIRGFSMNASCAPYKNCSKSRKSRKLKYISSGSKRSKRPKRSNKNKSEFLFNPNNPKKSFDVYVDKNPNNTISIKYKTYEDTKKTIKKLERLYRNNLYSHKRIFQVAMILMVRLRVIKDIKPSQYKLAKRYFDFI